MRVLMIPSFFKNKDNPSSGSFFTDQAILLKEMGHDVTIIFADTYSVKYIADFFHYAERNEELNGVRVLRGRVIAPLKHNGVLGNENAFVSCCMRIVRENYQDTFPFDIIHAQNCVWAGSAAYHLSQKYSVPYIITEHSSIYELGNKKQRVAIKPRVRKFFNYAKGIICVSEKLKKTILQYTSQEIEVIGNVVDTDSYSLISRDGIKNHEFVFTTVAFLTTAERVRLKGIDQLIKGFKRLAEEKPECRLKIIGVPKDDMYLSKMLSDENLSDKVSLIEPLAREQIFLEYQSTHCFVLLSEYETFGLVYAEAMATGLPIVATDVGIVSEIIDDSTGIICKYRTDDCIYNALKRICESYEMYDPKYIRSIVKSKYDKNVIFAQIDSVYRRVAK